MLEALVAQNLRFKEGRSRKFILSVSGGLDSTVLLHLMAKLRVTFQFGLEVFHVNFQLRGEESKRDESFVQKLTESLDVPLHSYRAKISGKTSIQEKARAKRLEFIEKLPKGDLVEAHHADDQVETFLLRLFRGSGIHGLSAMSMESERGGRRIWRPLLLTSKEELRAYARGQKISFCEDVTNRTLIYDRNWIRNKILPEVEIRYPKVKQAILRAIAQIQEESSKPLELVGEVLAEDGWRWEPLKGLAKAELQRWIHEYFRRELRIFLSRDQILDLTEKIQLGKAFSFNAPKSVILKGRPRSRTLAESKIFFLPQK